MCRLHAWRSRLFQRTGVRARFDREFARACCRRRRRTRQSDPPRPHDRNHASHPCHNPASTIGKEMMVPGGLESRIIDLDHGVLQSRAAGQATADVDIAVVNPEPAVHVENVAAVVIRRGPVVRRDVPGDITRRCFITTPRNQITCLVDDTMLRIVRGCCEGKESCKKQGRPSHAGGACQSSTLFPSGSITQPNFPYSESSVFSRTWHPSSRSA